MKGGPGRAERLRWKQQGALEAASARVRCGIGIRELARALGVSHAAVRRWESGWIPWTPAGQAYLRVIAGLRRHLEVPEEEPLDSVPLAG